MIWLLGAAAALVLLAGAFPGPRGFECDCQACWYVGEVPEGVMPCMRKLTWRTVQGGGDKKVLWTLLLGGAAAFALLTFMRSKKGRPAAWMDAWVGDE